MCNDHNCLPFPREIQRVGECRNDSLPKRLFVIFIPRGERAEWEMLLFVEAGKLKRCPSNTALIEYNGRCIFRWKRKMIFKEIDQELSERAKMYICPDNCVTPPLISANLPEHQVSRALGNPRYTVLEILWLGSR